MEIEAALLAKLQTVVGVTSLTSTRIYYVGRTPQSTPRTSPYLVIQKISDTERFAHDGPTAFKEARIQINSFDDDYLGSKALARAVKDGINGVKGTWGTVIVLKCNFDGDTDMPGESEADLTGIAADYLIRYNE
jgi:hypothetical protein